MLEWQIAGLKSNKTSQPASIPTNKKFAVFFSFYHKENLKDLVNEEKIDMNFSTYKLGMDELTWSFWKITCVLRKTPQELLIKEKKKFFLKKEINEFRKINLEMLFNIEDNIILWYIWKHFLKTDISIHGSKMNYNWVEENSCLSIEK